MKRLWYIFLEHLLCLVWSACSRMNGGIDRWHNDSDFDRIAWWAASESWMAGDKRGEA